MDKDPLPEPGNPIKTHEFPNIFVNAEALKGRTFFLGNI